jgi:hypothetical protein
VDTGNANTHLVRLTLAGLIITTFVGVLITKRARA